MIVARWRFRGNSGLMLIGEFNSVFFYEKMKHSRDSTATLHIINEARYSRRKLVQFSDDRKVGTQNMPKLTHNIDDDSTPV